MSMLMSSKYFISVRNLSYHGELDEINYADNMEADEKKRENETHSQFSVELHVQANVRPHTIMQFKS